jgi:hypothetical protein
MDIKEIERLHDRGLMPDWWYYQVNGKSAEENFNAQHKKMMEEYMAREREQEQKAAIEKYVNEVLEKNLEKCLEKALGSLFK